jgi:hypothetical protein
MGEAGGDVGAMATTDERGSMVATQRLTAAAAAGGVGVVAAAAWQSTRRPKSEGN